MKLRIRKSLKDGKYIFIKELCEVLDLAGKAKSVEFFEIEAMDDSRLISFANGQFDEEQCELGTFNPSRFIHATSNAQTLYQNSRRVE